MKCIEFFLLLGFGFVCNANAASFNCAKAGRSVEKAICSDEKLSKLDERLSEVYKLALKEYPVKNYLKFRQRDWNKNHDCDREEKVEKKYIECLVERYETRISQLTNLSAVKIYATSKDFDFAGGDAVAEIREQKGALSISIWGGFEFIDFLLLKIIKRCTTGASMMAGSRYQRKERWSI